MNRLEALRQSGDINALADYARRCILAERQEAGGGEDIGFSLDSSGWVRTWRGVKVVIEPWEDHVWRRAKYRGGRLLSDRFFDYAREAMEAK